MDERIPALNWRRGAALLVRDIAGPPSRGAWGRRDADVGIENLTSSARNRSAIPGDAVREEPLDVAVVRLRIQAPILNAIGRADVGRGHHHQIVYRVTGRERQRAEPMACKCAARIGQGQSAEIWSSAIHEDSVVIREACGGRVELVLNRDAVNRLEIVELDRTGSRKHVVRRASWWIAGCRLRELQALVYMEDPVVVVGEVGQRPRVHVDRSAG